MTEDVIAALYAIASDGEAATLDDLRRRAGQTWDCADASCNWTNVAADLHCGSCGAPRMPDLYNDELVKAIIKHATLSAGGADPELARSTCRVACQAFLITLGKHQLEGHRVDLLRGSTFHQVVQVDEWVIDWTARQFDPSAAFPLVARAADFYFRWDSAVHHRRLLPAHRPVGPGVGREHVEEVRDV